MPQPTVLDGLDTAPDCDEEDALAMMVHDLRTPLAALSQALQVLQRGRAGMLNDAQARFVAMGLDNAEVALRLADSLRSASRRGSAGLGARFARLACRAPAELVVNALQARAGARDVRLCLDGDGAVPDAWADEDLVRRMLFNLVDNAIRHAREGGCVRVVLGRSEPGGEVLAFEVADDGPGLPPEEHGRVFRRYYRATTPGSVPHDGSGLGLALVRDAAEWHGGQASVRNNDGPGCTFAVTLPLFASGRAATLQLGRCLRSAGADPFTLAVLAAAPGDAARVADRLVLGLDPDRWALIDLGGGRFGVFHASPRADGCRVTEVIAAALGGDGASIERLGLVAGTGATTHAGELLSAARSAVRADAHEGGD